MSQEFDRVSESDVYTDWVAWVGPKMAKLGLDVVTVLDEDRNEAVYVVVNTKNKKIPHQDDECLSKVAVFLGTTDGEEPITYVEFDNELLSNVDPKARAVTLAFSLTQLKLVTSLFFPNGNSEGVTIKYTKKLYKDAFKQFNNEGFDYSQWAEENLSQST